MSNSAMLTLLEGSLAQSNLVPNGGFEEYTCIPENFGMLECAAGWRNPIFDGCQLPMTCPNPDYLHNLSTSIATLPSNIVADVNPFEGNAIAGFIGWNTASMREYLSTELSQPLVVGGRYYLKFQMTNGVVNDTESGAGWGVSNVGANVSTYLPVQDTELNIGILPHLYIDSIWYSEVWEEVGFVFVADSSYEYLTIGNFFRDNQVDTAQFVSNTVTTFHNSYYFIDDVSVVRLDTVNSIYEWEETVSNFRQTTEQITMAFNENVKESVALLYDMAGRETVTANGNGSSLSLSIGHLPKGMYVLHLQTGVGLVSRKVVIP